MSLPVSGPALAGAKHKERTAMISYNERRTPIMLGDGVHDFGVSCANCADHIAGLSGSSIEAYLYGQSVALCSGQCWRRLLAVWAPTRRVWPIRQVLACLVVLIGAIL